MVYVLTHISNGDVINLSEQKEYTVGRKECDILLENDASISRKHAILRVKNNHVTIEDCSSRYNTFRNKTKLTPKVEVTLNHNDSIQFGIYNNKYCFKSCDVILIVAASALSSQKKAALKVNLAKLNATYSEKWSEKCTHLTVDRLTLTVKVLQALIDEKPIVTLEYWEDFAKSVEQKLPLPQLDKYNKPPVAEQLLRADFEYKFDPSRKSLFKNKIFVFQKSSSKKQMEEVIEKCGGRSVSFEENPIAHSEINKSPLEYLLVTSEVDEKNVDYENIINLLKKENKRDIPINEIALAIVYCSCDVNCNPNFNKVSEALGAVTQQTKTKNVLAMETQTQNVDLTIKTEKCIPPTAEADWMATSNASANEMDSNPEPSGGVKRPSKDSVESTAKKFKLEGGMTKQKTEKPTKQTSLNLFIGSHKNKSIVSIEDSPQKDKVVQKRKATDELETTTCLKINPFNRLTTSKKSKSFIEEENPFLLTGRKTSKTPVEKTKINPFENIINISNRADSVSIKTEKQQPKMPEQPRREIKLISDLSAISSTKRSILNSTWMTKSGIKREVTIKEEDPEIAKIIEAFKGCVKVAILQTYERAHNSTDASTSYNNVDGKKNFKKFRKANVLRPQIRVIGRQELKKCSSGDVSKSLIQDNECSNDSEDEISTDARNLNSKKPVKAVGKRFVL